jgi:hypothetical protein
VTWRSCKSWGPVGGEWVTGASPWERTNACLLALKGLDWLQEWDFIKQNRFLHLPPLSKRSKMKDDNNPSEELRPTRSWSRSRSQSWRADHPSIVEPGCSGLHTGSG